MDVKQSLSLIIQVVLTRATGNSVEIDSWKQALQVLNESVNPQPQPEEPKEVV